MGPASDRLVAISPQNHELAVDVLDVDPARVATIANGVDTATFSPRVRSTAQRLTQWKRWLVDDPRGWRPGGAAGSISYDVDDLAAFTDEHGEPVPVVVFAGRFMRTKRVPLLIEAHQAMRTTTGHRSVLVIAGGFPGEWEDEHPYDTVRRIGADGVFFSGWRDHDDLAEILRCGDVFAAPAVDEPFGLVYLEAMAAGLPPIATNTGGPASFIIVDPARATGWLVPPDDIARDRARPGGGGHRSARPHRTGSSSISVRPRAVLVGVLGGRAHRSLPSRGRRTCATPAVAPPRPASEGSP